uniref:Phosphatidic acid phosphatase type 2/haloperoxidase domain-containing protein n=1 Tax=Globisporangium ultimum (strain ATCC 200006 / CBS 805.95 / DAOM BR144) TaxID=431595 RepID=K3X7F6_GLOUD
MALRALPARHGLLLLLLLVATTALATAAHHKVQCSSPEECCQVCGPDSHRCARGPCSRSFITKKVFSISMPTHDVGFWDVAFSFYGMVPYLVPVVTAIIILAGKRTWTLLLSLAFIPIVTIINETIIGNVLGECTRCQRPCGSCLLSTGMPSGHATNTIGLCFWVILETILGVGRYWSMHKRALVVGISVLLLVPVPYSREYLGDHTALQVGLGSVDGIVLAVIYFIILRRYVAKRLDRWSAWLARDGKWYKLKVRVVNDFSAKVPVGADEVLITPNVYIGQATNV